jgi:catechol 2,3-dioxygenase-like lactoylglutathione lyase family enzyme
MTARFNHTIIAAKSRRESVEFYRHVLEADDAPSWGPFENLRLDGDVPLRFDVPPIEFPPQHYAFIMSDDHFDRALGWIKDRGMEFWTNPQRQRPAGTNTEHGGRGVYTLDPAGHYIELITQPYL